jgi:hypothetical protein
MQRIGPRGRRTRYWLNSLLLLTLTLRALIPAGYMPAADGSFALDLCPDGLPAQIVAYSKDAIRLTHASHHDHANAPSGGQHSHGFSLAKHCIFAAALSAAALTHGQPIVGTFNPSLLARIDRQPLIFCAQCHRSQQPRAPPASI